MHLRCVAYSFLFIKHCAEHNAVKVGWREFIMPKDYVKSFYNSKEWQSVRSFCLIRDRYKCRICGKPAEEVHHIKHISPNNILDIKVTLNPDNLISICKDCHFKQHGIDRITGKRDIYKGEWTWDDDGQFVPKPPVDCENDIASQTESPNHLP